MGAYCKWHPVCLFQLFELVCIRAGLDIIGLSLKRKMEWYQTQNSR